MMDARKGGRMGNATFLSTFQQSNQHKEKRHVSPI
jgi:hypothetical protein